MCGIGLRAFKSIPHTKNAMCGIEQKALRSIPHIENACAESVENQVECAESTLTRSELSNAQTKLRVMFSKFRTQRGFAHQFQV